MVVIVRYSDLTVESVRLALCKIVYYENIPIFTKTQLILNMLWMFSLICTRIETGTMLSALAYITKIYKVSRKIHQNA